MGSPLQCCNQIRNQLNDLQIWNLFGVAVLGFLNLICGTEDKKSFKTPGLEADKWREIRPF